MHSDRKWRGEVYAEDQWFEHRLIWNDDTQRNVSFKWCKDGDHLFCGEPSHETCPRPCLHCDMKNYDDYETLYDQT